jgi:STE24 endopeptidase
MLHVLIIAVFLAVLVRGGMGTPALYTQLGPWGAAAASLGALAGVWLLVQALVWRWGRALDRHGWARAARLADTAVGLSRFAYVGVHVVNVLVLGWLDAVRAGLAVIPGAGDGDLVAIDELLAAAPPLAAIAMSWWTLYPIDRRLREAVLMRDLDDGRPVHPPLPRGAFVWMAVRHHVLLVAIPVSLIVAWSEAVHTAAGPVLRAGPPGGQTLAVLGVAGAQIAGLVAIFGLIPPVMCRLWQTRALPEGDLRGRLTGMCGRYRVRVRQIRLWWTRGTMANGAVIGLFGPLRYILLTDALLEDLSERQVEAVMAHELAHVRCRHMLWLAVALGGTILAAGGILHLGAHLLIPGAIPAWADALLTAGAFAAALLVFGLVSRRFEWQADAFAVRHLSRGDQEGTMITPDAAATLSSALERVARLNHVPVRMPSWRHGSIAHRQDRIADLMGRRVDHLPIDREAGLVKALSALALAVGIALVIVDYAGVV